MMKKHKQSQENNRPTPHARQTKNYDIVYKALLKLLDLTQEHRKQLNGRRGLTDGQIEKLGYKSLPWRKQAFCHNLIKDGHSLEGVPGFWKNKSNWDLTGKTGILIPVRDRNGLITGLKIRVDKPVNRSAKYILLSSNPKGDQKREGYSGGTKARVSMHWPLDKPKGKIIKVLRITEGELKADITNSFIEDGSYTISLPGVSSWRLALEAVREVRPQEVRLAFDADKDDTRGGSFDPETEEPVDVGQACANLFQALRADGGFKVIIEDWPLDAGKGIDDVLLNGAQDQIKLLEGEKAEEWARGKLPLPDWLKNIEYIDATQTFIDRRDLWQRDQKQFDNWFEREMKAHKESRASKLALEIVPRNKSLIYLPCQPPHIQKPDGCYFNLWRPPLNIIVPKAGSVKPLLSHFECFWPDDCVHLIEALAWNFQKPGKKLLYALLLQSKEGAGKSIIRDIAEEILGPHNVKMISNQTLHEKYTAWGKDICLLFPDELMGHYRLELTERFKAWITERLFEVRDMYGVVYTQPNKFNVIAFTNHQDALVLKDAERRWCVLLSNQPVKDVDTYYAPLWDWRRQNIDKIYNYFLNYDLSKFNRYKRAPETSGKTELIRRTATSLETFLRDALEDKCWPMQGDVINNTSLLRALLHYPRLGALQLGRLNKRTLHDALENIGSKYLGHFEIAGTGWRHLHSLQGHDYWRSASQQEVMDVYQRWLSSLERVEGYKDEWPM
jgi:hypothetical protein